MTRTYELVADCDGREIAWEYGHLKHAAWRAFRIIRDGGRTHDTGRPVFSATLRQGSRVLAHVDDDALAIARRRTAPLVAA